VLAALVLPCAACLLNDSPDPQYRPLGFLTMVLPTHAAAGDSVAIDVAFGLGPTTCWRTDHVGLQVEGNEIRIEGTSVNPDPEAFCGDVAPVGRAVVRTPALAPGSYSVRAGDLAEILTVASGDSTGPPTRLVYAGRLFTTGATCEVVWHGTATVVLSGLPSGLSGNRYLVRADIVPDDPCGLPPGTPVDYFAVVREYRRID